jgi:choline dehydrogenase-like flavoprotein
VLIDGRDLENGTVVEADVCIVGAGAAGITLARALMDRQMDVCLLESGGLAPDNATRALSRGENGGLPYFPLDANRRRCFGGTTGLWAGWCRPLDDLDFEARAWVPESGWPFGREELAPYYRRAHAVCALGADDYEPAAWEARLGCARLPLPAECVETRIYRLSAVRFGRRWRRALARAPGVRVLLHSNLLEIITDRAARAVMALRVGTLRGTRFSVVARDYVLAAGGVENARLLLLSDGARPAGLGNDHDLVGRYFMEHVHFPSGTLRLADPRPAQVALYRAKGPAVARLFLPAAVQARERLLNASIALDPGVVGVRGRLARALRAAGEGVRRRVRGLAGRDGRLGPCGPRARGLSLHYTLEQAPNPGSRVTLAAERDALGLRRARLEWRMTALEPETFRRCRHLLDEALRRTAIGWIEADRDERGDVWPPPPLQGRRGHHMGTTRMSPDPRRGVVDAHCRVHGVANLYVAGSSVFPTAGAGTPTLTILALALRLADHIGAARGSGP